MRARTAILLPLILLLGFVAIQAVRFWLDRQVAERVRLLEAQGERHEEAPAPKTTIVVAASSLAAGAELTAANLREIPWIQSSVPKGAFPKLQDLLGSGKRFATSAMDADEIVLLTKITGPGIRPNLASSLDPGMKAVSVRVDDIMGVAGFVLPGDRVDVLLTRVIEHGNATNDLILQNIKVLAIDQLNDERLTKPAIAKSVTLEVDTRQAQKLMVAQASGLMTLVLRPAGVADMSGDQRMTLTELLSGNDPRPVVVAESPIPPPPRRSNSLVGVTRGLTRQEYSVPVSPARLAAALGAP